MTTAAIERLYKITVDGTKAVNSLKKIEKSTDGINNKLVGVGKAMKAAFALIGTGAIAADFKRIAEDADRIGKTASKIGLTAESLQELRYGAELSGVEVRTLDMAMQRFARRTGEAAAGSGELAATFNRLGIDLKNSNGTMRDTDDILNDYADALQNASSSQEQLRLAFKGFDSEGAALVNMLRNGSKGLDDFRKAAQDAGTVMGGDIIENAANLNDVMTKFSKQSQVFRAVLYNAVMPALTEFIESLTNVIPRITEWAKEQKYLTGTLATFSAVLNIIWEGLKNFGEGIIFVGRAIGALAAGGGFEALGEEFDVFTDKLRESRERIENSYNDIIDILSGKLPEEVEMPKVRLEEMTITGEVTDSWDKFRIAVYETAEASKEAGDVISRAGAKFADSFASGIADMVATGKASFKDLATSIIADITRMIAKQQIFNALASAFGPTTGGTTANANGNAFASATGLPFGVYDRPTYFDLPGGGPIKTFAKGGVLGEAGPEAIMPLKRGNDGKLGVSGSNTTVNVINNSGGQATVTEQQKSDGGREITVMIESAMEQAVASGRMDKVLGANYGLRRQGY